MKAIDANVTFSFSRSSGAGGQNVNKVNTRVTARLPLSSLSIADDRQLGRLRARLGGRMNAEDEIVVHVQRERSQLRNREIAVESLRALVIAALIERRPRRPTQPTKRSRRARLENKRRRAITKASRRAVDRHEDG